MLKAENTPGNTGIIISGTFDDLDSLYDAMALLVNPFTDEDKDSPLYDTAMHVLGICYDLRHAYMGDRELRMVDNHVDTETMKYHGMICPLQNVEFAFPTIWLEALFVASALNVFIDHRVRILAKTKYIYRQSEHYQVVFDKTNSIARNFQVIIMEALHGLIGDNAYARTAKLIASASEYTFNNFCSEYLNMLSIKYLSFDPEKKKKNLSIFIKRVLEKGQEYMDTRESIATFARENGCHVRDVRLNGTEFPEKIEW